MEWLDYGARMYDNQVGRFFTQDRFAEKYYAINPYQHCANNPILFTDYNGDSLIVNAMDGNKTAVNTYESQVNAGLGGFYTLGKSASGRYILNATGQEGEMTDEQQAFYNTMIEVISNKSDVSFTVVDGSDAMSQNISIADNGHAVDGAGTNYSALPGTHIIDVSDVGHFNANGVLSAQAILGHETKEGFEIQTKGLTTSKQMAEAHNAAIGIENSINGSIRISNPAGDFSENTLKLNFKAPTGYQGNTYRATVSATFTNGQITSVSGNTKLPPLFNTSTPKFRKI